MDRDFASKSEIMSYFGENFVEMNFQIEWNDSVSQKPLRCQVTVNFSSLGLLFSLLSVFCVTGSMESFMWRGM